MISKRKIINALFVLSFPFYGYGAYKLVRGGFAVGIFHFTIPYVLILGFYVLDLLYRQAPVIRVNRKFYLALAALASMSISIPVGLSFGTPLINQVNGILLVILFFVPFLSAVVVQAYNRTDPDYNFEHLVFMGYVAYLGVNLLGMAAGMRNLLHSFAGRVSPPFAVGIYDAAHTLAIFNLMLLFHLKDFRTKPMRWTFVAAMYMINLFMIVSINSRLSFMIFLVLTVLFVTRAMRALRGLFTVSLFTMPIMMSFALLIYEILSLPLFASLMGRVNKTDVTTFNGRTYIWSSAADWLMDDRRGLIFGNGFNGQYRLRMLDWVAKLWGESGSYRMHMHSAFLEILVNQGVVGVLLMYGVYWYGYKFYRHHYLMNTPMAPLYAAFVYMMFVWQIDLVGYAYQTGFALVFVLFSPVVMQAADEPQMERLG